MASKSPDKDLKEDFEFNKRLIELVKPNPWLYDNYPKLSQKVNQTWKEIAAELGDSITVRYLKLHWRWLREKYVRFCKTSSPDSPHKIASYMHFLKPHILKRQSNSYSVTMPKIARVESYCPVGSNTSNGSVGGVDCDYQENHLGYDPEDADATFLLSVLPHMRVMNGQQRRQFKMRAVTLSADILKES